MEGLVFGVNHRMLASLMGNSLSPASLVLLTQLFVNTLGERQKMAQVLMGHCTHKGDPNEAPCY